MEIEMSGMDSTGTIFVKEGTAVPASLAMESEEFLPGWRLVKRLDRDALARQIEGANWNFFYLAGGFRTTVIGTGFGSLRRAVKHILAKQSEKYNCLEITSISVKRFFGIPFLKVAAHSRHIQKSIYLIAPNDPALRGPMTAVTGLGIDRGEQLRREEMIAEPHAALV
jgi:hypothetical protein